MNAHFTPLFFVFCPGARQCSPVAIERTRGVQQLIVRSTFWWSFLPLLPRCLSLRITISSSIHNDSMNVQEFDIHESPPPCQSSRQDSNNGLIAAPTFSCHPCSRRALQSTETHSSYYQELTNLSHIAALSKMASHMRTAQRDQCTAQAT